jgi:hypothetical protein
VAVTSAETGPGVMAQISAITSAILRPDLAIRLGLVVTPSTRPASARERISDTSAVSTKNFMTGDLAGRIDAVRCRFVLVQDSRWVRVPESAAV